MPYDAPLVLLLGTTQVQLPDATRDELRAALVDPEVINAVVRAIIMRRLGLLPDGAAGLPARKTIPQLAELKTALRRFLDALEYLSPTNTVTTSTDERTTQ